jgi:hypothetical protein
MYILQGKTWPTRHVRFPYQSTYAQRTLPAGGPHPWQPFTSCQQSWAGLLLLRKGAPDTIHSTPADRPAGLYPVSLPSQPMKQWEQSQSFIDSRLLGLLSWPACDRYVQYLLTGANPLVLNRHRREVQPWRCRLVTYHFSTFPTSCLPFPPKGPARSPT